MDKKIESLSNWGCDIQDAMVRMFDDEEFYIECLLTIPGDENFDILNSALKTHDIKTAFDAAHTLKGVLSNLSLTPMYNKIVEIVEPLRVGDDSGLTVKFNELMQMKERLSKILSENS